MSIYIRQMGLLSRESRILLFICLNNKTIRYLSSIVISLLFQSIDLINPGQLLFILG